MANTVPKKALSEPIWYYLKACFHSFICFVFSIYRIQVKITIPNIEHINPFDLALEPKRSLQKYQVLL